MIHAYTKKESSGNENAGKLVLAMSANKINVLKI